MHTRWRPMLLLLTLVALAAGAAAQEKFSVHAKFDPAEAKPGDEVTLVLEAEVAEGWHAYGTKEETNVPVSLDVSTMQLGGLEAVGEPRIPPGVPTEGAFGMKQFPLPEHFAVRLKLKVPAGASGEIEVSGELGYQICDANSCLAPDTEAFSGKLKIAAAAPVTQEPQVKPSAGQGTGKPITVPGLKPGLQLAPDAKLTVKAHFEPATVRAGEEATLVLEAHVIDGWHAYGTKETTNVPVAFDHSKQQLGSLEFAGEAEVPEGELSMGAFGAEQYALPHEFEVKQRVRVPADAKPGEVVARGDLDYQVCDENSCDRPELAPWSASLKIEAGEARASAKPADSASPPEDKNPFASSWWALILASIGGGLFALAMPCTYPMIPITFSFFTKQAEKRHGSVLPLTLVYGLGIVAMFVSTGVLLSEVIQDVVNHWVTNAIIGVAFFFFAAVLFGWVNLNPPQWMQRLAFKAQSQTGGGGGGGMAGALVGVFFMGATLVITSFTCTAPIVGTLIAQVAKLGTARVAVGMAVFGLTMALPFMLLSLTPGKVKAMPKAGQWMDTLKISLGFVELAAAFKFVSMVDFYFGWQILPRELFLMIWTAVFGLWALFLFGILRKQGTPNEGVGSGRMAAGMVVTLLTAYFFHGALGFKMDFYTTNFIPGYSAQSVIARAGGGGEGGAEKGHVVGKHTIVLDDEPRAMELAKADDKLLLFNFTGFN
ncbi:MAG: protein-disulfide reductase DsbD family protein [Planctomycetota bacterium]